MAENSPFDHIPAKLRYIAERERLSVPDFAEKLGVKYTTFRNYFAGEKELPLSVCIRLLLSYNWVSPDWFLLHIGEMERSAGSMPAPSDSVPEYKAQYLASAANAGEKMVIVSESELVLLRQALKDKELIIKLLSE